MAKAPADQFYWGDWLNDVELQAASSTTRGVWINLLCRMWYAKTRGEISGPIEVLSSITNSAKPFFIIIYKDLKLSRFPNTTITPEKSKNNTYKINGVEVCNVNVTETNSLKIVEITEFELFLIEAKALRFCDIVTGANKIITVRNRRMFRRENERKSGRLRQQRHRERQDSNADVTPLSSSSSSEKTSKTIKKTIKKSVPNSFPVTERMKAYAKTKNYVACLEDLTEGFLLHHKANGSKFNDWSAAWQRWLRNEIKFYPERNVPPGTPKARTMDEERLAIATDLIKEELNESQNQANSTATQAPGRLLPAK